MNPLNFTGGEFLIFYLLLQGAGFLMFRFVLGIAEAGEVPRVPLDDPYKLAFLRGGANEALRVCALTLMDRGLVKEKDTSKSSALEAAFHLAEGIAHRPIERRILNHFIIAQPAASLFSPGNKFTINKIYQSELAQLGLVPDSGQVLLRFIYKAMILGPILFLGFVKLNLALARGKQNVGFLILLMVLYSGIFILYNPRRTPVGDRFLEDIKTLFERLKVRRNQIRSGGGDADLAFLLAVFGASEAPYFISSIVDKHFKAASSSSGCGSSCGSSYGSSCGSSCGSGCGGGCGGCGG